MLFCTFFIFRSSKANYKTNESKWQMQTMHRFAFSFKIKGKTNSWLEKLPQPLWVHELSLSDIVPKMYAS